MMDKLTVWGVLFVVLHAGCQPSAAPSLKGDSTTTWTVERLLSENQTPTWEEAVALAQFLAQSDGRCTLHEVGVSDVGRPIHALVLTGHEAQTHALDVHGVRSRIERSGKEKVTVLVNNAIHPGEPCGVNASLAQAAQWLSEPDHPDHPLRAMNWVIVPQYNVGGASRRNCCTRANQNGPELYGFRGNASNLDLNRDFIKMDSRNAEAFVALYHAVDPDVFVDSHTSNGADYPYTMTLITTQPDKAGPVLGPYLRQVLEPALYQGMEERGWEMVPYVYSRGETPKDGLVGFLETPRYSTGYTTLFGTLGFTTEAHMLKPFPDRVQATHAFLEVLSTWLAVHGGEVLAKRQEERSRIEKATSLPTRWTLSQEVDSLSFTGYASRHEWSSVTQGTRLRYDRSQTWTESITWANRYQASVTDDIPHAWVIPQAWRRVVDRLKRNGVVMHALPADTTLVLEVSWIESFASSNRPYEGHHPVSVDSVSVSTVPVQLYRGDWVIPADQSAKRYLAEVLSPRGHDSFLVWNFFDAALQRKEYYSGYVFEDTAAELLQNDDALRMRYEAAKQSHPEWRDNPSDALRWVYEQSPHNEGTANRYPVYRLPALASGQP